MTPRTVAGGFAEFAELLIPKYAKQEKAEANLAVIKRQLETQYDMSDLAPYGSTYHGTNVREYSALDHVAVGGAKCLTGTSRNFEHN